ncbi:MAG: presqualene diphosphate synthase HpnD [Betaproteobacteria bacterium]|nr:presqualene diphosphate synthase HpnD [Betaproteobacteria bacterium]
MTPDEYCADRVQRAGSSFYYSFLFLAEPRRRAMNALYAFCREVDDAVDENSDPIVASKTLDWWREELEQVFHGNPQHPVGQALAPVTREFGLKHDHFKEILLGMRMDLDYNRYPDFETLEVYCYRVAGVVGVLAAEVFGYRQPRTLEFARQLGIALQLTNIIRDVREDIDRNRVYLPLAEMNHFGVSVDDLVLYRETPEFFRLMTHQVNRARGHFQRASISLAQDDRRAQRASLVMGNIYRALLEEIADGGCRVLTQRTRLTPLRKLWIAWKSWVFIH